MAAQQRLRHHPSGSHRQDLLRRIQHAADVCLQNLALAQLATGDRAAELALRFKYAGLPEPAIEVVPDLGAALDRGLELTPAGGELVALPTYTAMLSLRDLVSDRGFVRPYWEEAAA